MTMTETSFNEARALCAGSFFRPQRTRSAARASMRPAHYAREVGLAGTLGCLTPICFNEARALCAGSLQRPGYFAKATPRFNEARALCAGSSPLLKPTPQASCGRPLRELNGSVQPCLGPSCPWGPILAHNSLIFKEQPPNASSGRKTGHDLSARNGAASHTIIGSREMGVKGLLPRETTLGFTLSAGPMSISTMWSSS